MAGEKSEAIFGHLGGRNAEVAETQGFAEEVGGTDDVSYHRAVTFDSPLAIRPTSLRCIGLFSA